MFHLTIIQTNQKTDKLVRTKVLVIGIRFIEKTYRERIPNGGQVLRSDQNAEPVVLCTC